MSTNWNTINGANATEQQGEFDVKEWDAFLAANFGEFLLDEVQSPGQTDWSLFPNGAVESELPANGGSNLEAGTVESAGPSHDQHTHDHQRRLEVLVVTPAFQHFAVRRINEHDDHSLVALPGRWLNPFELPQLVNGLAAYREAPRWLSNEHHPSHVALPGRWRNPYELPQWSGNFNPVGRIQETRLSPNYPFPLDFTPLPGFQGFPRPSPQVHLPPEVFSPPQAFVPIPPQVLSPSQESSPLPVFSPQGFYPSPPQVFYPSPPQVFSHFQGLPSPGFNPLQRLSPVQSFEPLPFLPGSELDVDVNPLGADTFSCEPLPDLPASELDVTVNPFDTDPFLGESMAPSLSIVNTQDLSPSPEADAWNAQYQQYLVTRSPLAGYLRQLAGEYEQEQLGSLH